MRFALPSLCVGVLLSVAVCAPALAAPIALLSKPAQQTFRWKENGAWEGSATLVLRAFSDGKLTATTTCSGRDANVRKVIAAATVREWIPPDESAERQTGLQVTVKYGYQPGTCTVTFQSENDVLHYTVRNNGHPHASTFR